MGLEETIQDWAGQTGIEIKKRSRDGLSYHLVLPRLRRDGTPLPLGHTEAIYVVVTPHTLAKNLADGKANEARSWVARAPGNRTWGLFVAEGVDAGDLVRFADATQTVPLGAIRVYPHPQP